MPRKADSSFLGSWDTGLTNHASSDSLGEDEVVLVSLEE